MKKRSHSISRPAKIIKALKLSEKEKLARKNFEDATGVPYDLRVKNLESGDCEW